MIGRKCTGHNFEQYACAQGILVPNLHRAALRSPPRIVGFRCIIRVVKVDLRTRLLRWLEGVFVWHRRSLGTRGGCNRWFVEITSEGMACDESEDGRHGRSCHLGGLAVLVVPFCLDRWDFQPYGPCLSAIIEAHKITAESHYCT